MPNPFLHDLLQLGIILGVEGVVPAECQGALDTGSLDGLQDFSYLGFELGARTKDLPALPGISRRAKASVPFSTSLGPISMRNGTPRISQSIELKAGGDFFAAVHLEPETLQLVLHLGNHGHHFGFFVVVLVNWHDDNLEGCQLGRQDQTLVIAVGHDDGADEASGKTPGSGPDVLQLIVLIKYWISKALAKFCPK